ncbi:MAG: alginate lyase family protein [Alphaproteobacteria bacterium]|nr:alginate lyase family protein [Alphaproteobacteria bacterium]
MSSLQKLGRFMRTVAPLRSAQITNRLMRRVFRPKPSQPMLLPLRGLGNLDFMPGHESPLVSGTTFRFLNREETLSFPADWDNEDLPLLWRYNLHYFDALMAPDLACQEKASLVTRWIEENPTDINVGWDPYPLSLRIVNWVKWFLQGNEPTTEMLESLYQQADFLEHTVEFHLLGNHLLENAKALLFAASYFEGPHALRWLDLAVPVLQAELEEQILADGAHFELSPMYHSIMLELVLDLIVLARAEKTPVDVKALLPLLTEKARSMADWLSGMVHPDGEISFFNDASIGIAKAPALLLAETAKLTGWSPPAAQSVQHFKASGYMRAEKGPAVLFFDAAAIGPSYLPGHGHADALSLELSLFGQRVITNVGTSEYGLGERREYERSTPAHSTVTIGGENSSETWAGFRVGRRARIIRANSADTSVAATLEGAHDGYRYMPGKPVHARTAVLTADSLTIRDTVTVTGAKAVSRFHFHPDVALVCHDGGTSGTLTLPCGKVIDWTAAAESVSLEPFLYAEHFGVLRPTQTLCLNSHSQETSELRLHWRQ